MQPSEKILKQYFGYDTFRPMQAEIITQILANQDTVVLMPTGGGKSICYQVPALMSEGLCVVVSPLISLMKDQVEALKRNNVLAAYYNSSQSVKEQMDIENQALKGELKLLYVSPEKLLTENFLNLLKKMPVSFFAIDEAHCISSWGHDFRPEYTQLKVLKQLFPQKAVVALTATADKLTRKDISEQLLMHNPRVFIASFDRKNISINVTPGINRIKKILQFLENRHTQSGIIYCLSRKNTEEVAEKLTQAGFKAKHYHAGMESNARAKVQEDFLKDDVQIICATIAFGMGIDKPNVRFVIHYNLPRNVEGYYQEIGRGGRDGLKCDAILFYSLQDIIVWRDIINKSEGSDEHRTLKFAKLERMQQFAEAQVCRRRILLSYFHENLATDCGNCDVCNNPRKTFDATVLAQKALSACIRLKEEVGINTLIEVLRGSRNQQILEKGYDKIKTFGAGKDLKFEEWRDYVLQMINLGVLEIAYDQNYALKQGLLANAVLYEGKQILLVKAADTPQIQESYEKPKSKTEILHAELFEALIDLRKRLADQQNIAPHIIFNDNTLNEMAKNRPTRGRDFLQISGVTEIKLRTYGKFFLKEIMDVSIRQFQEGANIKGMTQIVTYHFYQQGLSPEEIVEERAKGGNQAKLNVATIQSHLVSLYEKGYLVDLFKYISETELQDIQKILKSFDEMPTLSALYEFLQEKYDFFKLRIAIALMEKKNG